ncbi:hypothetical protein [Nonomuraea sp. NPDC050691]|uniref:hypothetical protein n=1 Tax=Nonomuraea sp. NPDC050691 TaxID=3155661 RepID=UPI0033E4018E
MTADLVLLRAGQISFTDAERAAPAPAEETTRIADGGQVGDEVWDVALLDAGGPAATFVRDDGPLSPVTPQGVMIMDWRNAIKGQVFFPGDDGFERAAAPWAVGVRQPGPRSWRRPTPRMWRRWRATPATPG